MFEPFVFLEREIVAVLRLDNAVGERTNLRFGRRIRLPGGQGILRRDGTRRTDLANRQAHRQECRQKVLCFHRCEDFGASICRIP